MSDPYFKGQVPHTCGHYYPDVLRHKDFKRREVYIGVIYCVHCGQYEEPLENLTEGLKRKLDLKE